MIDTLGIPLAFIIIATLTLWVIIGSKGWWWLKGLIVVVVLFFSISLWHSLNSLQGWPTDEKLPQKFEIKWITVKEPNMHTGEKGEIIVWAMNLTKEYNESLIPKLHNKEESGEPRLHRLPYSRNLHEQAMKIQKQIAGGGKFYGEMKENEMQGEGQNGQGNGRNQGQGKGKGKGQSREGKGSQLGDGSLSQEQEFIFHELPPPYFIPKEQ